MQVIRLLFLFVIIYSFNGCRDDNNPLLSIQPSVVGNSILKITSPGYLENWLPGTTHNIKWNAAKEIKKVDILLYRKSAQILVIKSGLENTSSFMWTVPLLINNSHHYRIKVVDASGNTEGYSDYFYIFDYSKPE